MKARRVVRAAGAVVGGLLVAGAVGGLWLRHRLTADLPRLSGRLAVAGVAAPLAIERDGFGIPTVRGATRRDVAFGTGFVHAQDRFFQMDLLRRRAAGELAELFGPAVLDGDRAMRVHRFRQAARRVVAASAPDVRGILDSYTAGVNAGLDALAAPPFEYLVLRAAPRRWQSEDSVLVLLTMFTQLEDVDGTNESALTLLHDRVPADLFRFLVPPSTEWDTPVAGTPPPAPPPPGPEVFDLRRRSPGSPGSPGAPGAQATPPAAGRVGASNSWAVAGRLAAGGGALLADELHLGLALPNVWYRAALAWPAEAAGAPPHFVVGATLPGTPAVVVGSNGMVAWGLTNSMLDTSDLVLLDVDPRRPDSYLTPRGSRRFERYSEVLHVRGDADRPLAVDWTEWGPVVDTDRRGRRRAVRAVVDDAAAVDFEILRLETAAAVGPALDIAARSGVPALNFVAADRAGHIGWTIAGRLPRRVGFDGETATAWADGARRWDGLVAPADVPRQVDPAAGRLWTANNRVLAGAAAGPLERGAFVLGARARQIRDDLFAVRRATVDDMRRIQLDDRALFLARWRALLLAVLTPRAVAADPRRGEMRRLVEGWGGRADVGSVGYRMVRTFRKRVSRAAFGALTAACRAVDPDFDYVDSVEEQEGPLWQLVSRRPLNLLDPRYRSWDDQLLAAADEVIARLARQGPHLADRTWGEINTLDLEHPLSSALPLVGQRLSMPPRQLPGDDDMPRVQGPSFGATLRMVVSPGREAEGLFQMPGGESGNPISSHYGDLEDAWCAGAPARLLPGKAVTTLTLVPGAAAPAARPSAVRPNSPSAPLPGSVPR